MSVYSTALLTTASASASASAWLPFFSILLPLLLLPLFLLNKNKNKNNPPSPPFKLPFIGHLHHIGQLPHRSLWRLSQKHGPIMLLQLGEVPTVIVSSAQMAGEVLKTHDLELATRPPLIAFKKLSYNFVDIGFAPYGDYWREMRKVSIVELFSVKRVQAFTHVRAEEVESMVQFTRDHSNKSDPSSATALGVDLSEMMTSLMYKMVCRVAFGRSYEAGSEQEKARFHGALLEAGVMLGGFFVGDFLPWLGWVDVVSGLRGRLERSFQALDAFYERLIEDHVHPKKGDEKKEEEDFVDVLLRVQKDMRLSRDNVKGVLMNVVIAGTETASATVVWAMTELMRSPKVMKKAQDEARRVAGKKVKVAESDLHQLEYLKAVIKETWRLHPPAPLLIPRETSRVSSIHNYELGPKTRIYVNAFAIGRDPQSWENPDEFWPERFIGSSIDYKGHDFQLIPFGSGRRGCPGIYLATMTVELVLANLLCSFDWKLPPGMKREDIDMDEAFGIVVHKKPALNLVPSNYYGHEQIEK